MRHNTKAPPILLLIPTLCYFYVNTQEIMEKLRTFKIDNESHLVVKIKLTIKSLQGHKGNIK